MTFSTFILSLTVLFIILLNRKKITSVINEKFYSDETKANKFQSEWIVYILTILFIAVISMGMLMDNTKEKYGQISEDFQKLKPQHDESSRPHRWFDINFEIFNFGKKSDLQD
jgi:hypothetical protein